MAYLLDSDLIVGFLYSPVPFCPLMLPRHSYTPVDRTIPLRLLFLVSRFHRLQMQRAPTLGNKAGSLSIDVIRLCATVEYDCYAVELFYIICLTISST